MRDDIQLMPAKEFFKEMDSFDSKRATFGITKSVKNGRFREVLVSVAIKARGVSRKDAEAIVFTTVLM